MKKSYFLAGLLSFGMLLSGCEKNKGIDDPSVDPGLKGEMEELTASKQKSTKRSEIARSGYRLTRSRSNKEKKLWKDSLKRPNQDAR